MFAKIFQRHRLGHGWVKFYVKVSLVSLGASRLPMNHSVLTLIMVSDGHVPGLRPVKLRIQTEPCGPLHQVLAWPWFCSLSVQE